MDKTLLRQVLSKSAQEIEELRGALSELTRAPIAILSYACRVPGADRTTEAFWKLLDTGEEGLSCPARRWKDTPFPLPPKAGLLTGVDEFDAEFFGISPREAAAMDPQQRLLLELAWEALERARLLPSRLRRTRSGVFVGGQPSDYPQLLPTDRPLDYVLTGQAASVQSGRLAYTLDLKGPAITVDTACSSSLVAAHLACRSLRSGECDLALVGGAHTMSTPTAFAVTKAQQLVSPQGRCRAFAAAADGVAWSEGAGLLVLKRLSDARRDGDPVLAVISGSAINQDGRSQGLAAPNGPAQQNVIREALAQAGVAPDEIDAIEAHGTGTSLGDPMEAEALNAVFPARGRPLWLGSCKSNIGHAQAAAGVLGLIKMVMALQHQRLPPSLHVDEPTPHVNWEDGPLKLLLESQEWPRREGHRRRAGVSSFGISGTNAHLVVEEPESPASDPHSNESTADLPILISGKSPSAVQENARRLAEALAASEPPPRLDDLAYSLAVTRESFSCRRSLLASREDAAAGYPRLRTELQSLAPAQPALPAPQLALLFPGQGCQRAGMGRTLHGRPPFRHFTQRLDEIAEACRDHLERDLKDVLWSEQDEESLQSATYAQPALFAIEAALGHQWLKWGLSPACLIGHSVGEFVAAYLAGVFQLEDVTRLVCARGRLMDQHVGTVKGGLLVLPAGENRAVSLMEGAGLQSRLSVAALNSASQTVLSGDLEALQALSERAEDEGLPSRVLDVSHAFHSHHLDPMLEAFGEVARTIDYSDPQKTVISTLTGQRVDPRLGDLVSPDYWVRQLRQTVRFSDAVETVLESGPALFLECGPRPSLTPWVPHGLATLSPPQNEPQSFLTALGALYSQGLKLDFESVFSEITCRKLDLPTYAFQRQRYWPEPLSRDEGEDWPQWSYHDTWVEHRPDSCETEVEAEPAPEFWLVGAGWEGQVEGPASLVQALERRCLVVRKLTVEDVAEALSVGSSTIRVLYFPAPHANWSGVMEEVITLCRDVFAKRPRARRIWFLTPHSLSTGPADPPVSASLQAIWGYGRTLTLEQPSLFGGMLDLAATGRLDADGVLNLLLSANPLGDEFAFRDKLLTRRLLPGCGPATGKRSDWKPTGAVLVTGGTGHLGRRLVRWLGQEGAGPIIVATRGRQPIPEDSHAHHHRVCDVADSNQVLKLLRDHPVEHIFHLAGGEESVSSIADPERLVSTMACKVEGAWNLHRAARDLELPLKSFVLFGSVAGFWGSGGQAIYSASNAALQGLIEHRRAAGRCGTVIHWGPWTEGGTLSAEWAEYLKRRGLRQMSPRVALTILKGVLAAGLGSVAAASVDWNLFGKSFSSGRPRPLLGRLWNPDPTEEKSPAPATTPDLTEAQIGSAVRRVCAAVLGLGEQDMASRERVALGELGMDSLMCLEISDRLSRELALKLPTTLALEHPTVEGLSRHLRRILPLKEPQAAASTLVPLADGPARPLFIVPGAWGGVLSFQRFARSFQGERTVFGLNVEGTEENEQVSFQTLSQRYLRDLQAMVPDGPYHLLGFSSGALVAFEMARRLGSQMGTLILLDKVAPGEPRQRLPMVRDLPIRLHTYLQIARQATPIQLWNLVKHRMIRGSTPPPITVEVWLAVKYESESGHAIYPGRAHLLRYIYQPFETAEPTMGWKRLIPEVKVHRILGTHGAMSLQEPVCLRTAQLVEQLIAEHEGRPA